MSGPVAQSGQSTRLLCYTRQTKKPSGRGFKSLRVRYRDIMTDDIEDIFTKLEATENENGYFTRVHVANWVTAAEDIASPHEAHTYIDRLEEKGVIEEIEKPGKRTVRRHTFDEDYDPARIADEYDPGTILEDEHYDDLV